MRAERVKATFIPDRQPSVWHVTEAVRFTQKTVVPEEDRGPWELILYGEFDGRRRKRRLVKIRGVDLSARSGHRSHA